MKLLFLTQVMDRNDAVLGFVPRWIEAFASRCDRVRVVALEVGDVSDLPENVDVREVGRRGKIKRYLRYRTILKEAFGEGFDAVLSHMVPRYALVSEGLARRAGAKSFLWYTHGGVDARLQRAVPRMDRVFTASEESMRVPCGHKVVTGHGIDLAHFDPISAHLRGVEGTESLAPPRLLSVGRMTPKKDPLTILAALGILVSRGFDLSLDVVGGELAAGDPGYRRAVEEQIEVGQLGDRVHLHGSVPYRDIPPHFWRSTLLVNASFTGSVDKVVLESMAARRPIVTCNESFGDLLAPLGEDAGALMFEKGSANDLADKIEGVLRRTQRQRAALGERLRALVQDGHEVEDLMGRLVAEMESALGERV